MQRLVWFALPCLFVLACQTREGGVGSNDASGPQRGTPSTGAAGGSGGGTTPDAGRDGGKGGAGGAIADAGRGGTGGVVADGAGRGGTGGMTADAGGKGGAGGMTADAGGKGGAGGMTADAGGPDASKGGAGGTGGVGAGGSQGTDAGDDRPPDTGDLCPTLLSKYAAALVEAKRCDPMANGPQCQQTARLTLPCSTCTTHVNEVSQLNMLRSMYDAAGCPTLICPVSCPAPGAGACTAVDGGGMCVDIPQP